MSTSLENHGSPWRKRPYDDFTLDIKDIKRPRQNYYRLESESSKASDDGTESICSFQERETDFVQDSSDLNTDSDEKGSEYDVQFEYEVASLSEDDGNLFEGSTTDSEMMLAAAAAVICQNSFEGWITDVEDSDSSTEESSFKRTDFSTCVQCKGENINPMYRYCEKCFQERKKYFPPRPKRRKNRPKKKEATPPRVKLDTLRSCLSGLSQDSGLGSSQECPSFGLDQIVVPEHLQSTGTSKTDDSSTNPLDPKQPENIEKISRTSEKSPNSPTRCVNSENALPQKTVPSLKRNRTSSESSLSEHETPKKLKASESQGSEQHTSDLGSEASSSVLNSFSSVGSNSSSSGFFSENNLPVMQNRSSGFGSDKSDPELCIFCNNAPKNSIFLHTNIAHCCCCYPCAKKTLKSIKRCPICNGTVNKVLRIFTT
ncbi:uncharacterized protein LOC126748802 isoform X2 [Anthonomus grandis grandis]|nr:uncharacterized protein LOC126748802 isoform X2 [Anthonomus grandis grandis]XP_050314226.1 uncharacterized protein LOC126748802 isoform X2 [Anthonomus grandis grandis]